MRAFIAGILALLSAAASAQVVSQQIPIPVPVAQGGTGATTSTGSGSVVLSTSPVLVTPVLGTPASGVATNLTGTAAGLTAGNVTTNANLTGPITSTGNATAVAAQTGTGSTFVMQASPTLTTPVLGVAAATTVNKVTLTAPATGSTLTIADGKTLTLSNTLTLAGTDGSTLNIGAGSGTSGHVLCFLDASCTISAPWTFGSSAVNFVATGGSTSRSVQTRFSERINVKDYGAVGDGVADDSAALSAAEIAAIAQSNGHRAAIYLPAGVYLIKGTSLPLINKPLRIFGDGPHKTYLLVDKTYSGDIFPVSEVWQGGAYVSGMAPSADNAGFSIDGLTVMGDTTASAPQNFLAFYDRNDHVLVKDVEVFFLKGQCLSIGALKNQTQGYMRESVFTNLKCSNTGTSTAAAVDISSTSTSGSDATNELQFFKLHIFSAASTGLTIRNPNNFSSTRLLEFFAPRVEYSAGDNIQVGSASDAGQVSSIRFYGLESITPGQSSDGFFGLNLNTSGVQAYDVMVMGGQVGPCWSTALCKGVNIGNVRLSRIGLENVSTAGTNITVASTVGADVVVDGNGAESTWTYSINSGVLSKVNTPIFKSGDPSSASGTTNPAAVTAAIHDGSSTFGNPAGAGAVDLQIVRNANSQIAALTGSVLMGGAFNSIGGNGSQAAIVGGSSNIITGVFGFMGAGALASDRGRAATQTFSAGQFATRGDAQTATMVLRGTGSSTSAIRLTADLASAGSTNCINIPNNAGYELQVDIVALDHTTVTKNESWGLWTGLLTRGANAASTALTMAATPIPIANGTVVGSAIAATADTTNGCLNVSFTPPTGNTDVWNVVAKVLTVEVQ